MKFKNKLLSFLTAAIVTTSLTSLLIINNTNQTTNNITTINSKKNDAEVISRVFDGSLIGATNGSFILEYKENDIEHCTIRANKDFTVKNTHFNFNGGKFDYAGKTYTITKIADNAFKMFYSESNTNLRNVFLTIPSTIKEIGEKAFYGCQIKDIQFEPGIESIGHQAFYMSDDMLAGNTLVFPNSIKYVACDAFYGNRIEKWDLSQLDHVIETDENDGYGIVDNFRHPLEDKQHMHIVKYYSENITIITKDETMKNEYCANGKYEDLIDHGKIIFDGQEEVEIKLPSYSVINSDKGSDEWYCGNFSIKYTTKDNCKLVSYSEKQRISGEYNFNNGQFQYGYSNFYRITEIGEVFYCWSTKYFDNAYITIPSTVKKIGDNAFNGCSRNLVWKNKEIRAIKFEEGIEDIGVKAFRKCKDIKEKTIKIPNSVKHIGNDAFTSTSLKEVDLTALDHVISVDCKLNSNDSCLPSSVKKVYVKDEAMKAKYLLDKNWNDIAKKICVK